MLKTTPEEDAMIKRYLTPQPPLEDEDPDPLEAERKRAAGYVPSSQGQADYPPYPSSPASISAVERCAQTFEGAYKAAIDRRESQYSAERIGKKAYLKVMPPLLGRNNIRDFIACVSQAMCWEIIPHSDGTKLLYAAQVAYNTTVNLKKKKKSTKTPPKSTTFSSSDSAEDQPNQ